MKKVITSGSRLTYQSYQCILERSQIFIVQNDDFSLAFIMIKGQTWVILHTRQKDFIVIGFFI